MKSTPSTLKALFLLLALGGATAALAEPAGTVMRVNGDASAKDANGKSRGLSAGSAVNEGDVISTTTGAAIQLQMKDNALLALTGDAALRIKAYNFEEANGEPDKVQLTLEKGRFRTITGEAPKKVYHLESKVALVSINGTTYDVLVDSTTGKATVILRDGAVTVASQCDGKVVEGNAQLLDVPGMAAVVEALCKDPKPAKDQDVADLNDILPIPKKGCLVNCDLPKDKPKPPASP